MITSSSTPLPLFIVPMATLLTFDPDSSLYDDVPILDPGDWPTFSVVMEMLFMFLLADYLIDARPSTPIPASCVLLDQQLFHFILDRVGDDLKPLFADVKSPSALQAWILLVDHFQGPISPPSSQDTLSMDIATPSVPDHSMAAITHSHPMDVITPFAFSVVPSSCSSLHTATLWTSSSHPPSLVPSFKFFRSLQDVPSTLLATVPHLYHDWPG